MNNNFITIKQAQDLELIRDIVAPAIGNVSDIEPCVSEACNSYAYLLNKHLIVKFAKDDAKLEKLLLEKNVLSFLKGKTTLKIPESTVFKNHFTFSIHEMIQGETFQNKHYQRLAPPRKDKFCHDVALFMYELHSLTDKINTPNLPQLKGIAGLYPLNGIKEFFKKRNELTRQEQNFVTRFCDEFTNHSQISKNAFGHFDIQPKNIAFDFAEDKISGIYDFGDCGFCDISYDFTKFAIQYNPEILNNVLKHYQNLSGLKLNVPAILSNSTYCVLHCLMKDIEKNRSPNRGLYELRLKISQQENFPY